MKKISRMAAVMLVILGLAAAASPTPSQADESVRLVCLNIGKADCMLLLLGENAYLIDAGYPQNYPALEMMLRQYGVNHLQGVFLTHCHQDHMGGLEPLANSGVLIDHWYAAAIYTEVKPEKHPAVRAAALRGQQVEFLKCGDRISAGKDAEFTVLGPVEENPENENNNSLVLRFSCAQGSILLCGDMKEAEENSLLARNLLTPCTLIKIGHHGDSGATKKALLGAVKPKAALILTNTLEEPDTPAASTLSRLSQAGCKVYVSQDMHDAMEAHLLNGEVTVRDIAWDGVPLKAQGLALSLDLGTDICTIKNTGKEALPLAGYALYSTKGNDLLSLPDKTLAPGEALLIGTRATAGDYDVFWNLKRAWHQKDTDQAILYDAYGRGVAWADNGL